MSTLANPPLSQAAKADKPTIYRILFAISLVHLFNDSIQAVFPAMNNPIFRDTMHLSYTQIGFIAFGLNFTASIMQPIVGIYTDKRPSPFLLPLGMVSTFLGMLLLAFSNSYPMVLVSVVLVGIGSAVFHPEGSRVANMASGTRRGLAQSIFQVGGNGGQALAPLFTILILLPLGQKGTIWFTLVAAAAILVQIFVASWYTKELAQRPRKAKHGAARVISKERKRQVMSAMVVLIFLVFVRSWYHTGISNYFVSYLREELGMGKSASQYFLFAFLAAGALGTFFGGPIADRIGRKKVLFFSMVGSAPFALLLPYVHPALALVLLLIIGFIILSSFSVAVVYAQELIPGKIGTVSGLVTGLAFGLGAVGAVVLGNLIDMTSLSFVMKMCSFLPLLGVATYFLPSDSKLKEWSEEQGEMSV
ncbi:MFS transporter [Gorillibacterium massiliense]|uniref:MFS transporter n=1 Tax=Gorillibacterium massiliense TaxID=1280390 RepID=UPI0004B11AB0|nr:MFS transporter [Gorillibacterium massiliense]